MRIGIDLGGTNIAAAIVGDDGGIIKRAAVRTVTDGSASAVIDGLLSVCETLAGNGTVPQSIGIGVPGTVNSETNMIAFTPNLPLSGVNVAEDIRKKYGCPVFIGNDANCAALGETIAGGAKGARDVVFITLGTGVGGGLIIGGKLYTGTNGVAGELGHMVIISGGRECGCGRKGCWERYASASGLKETAVEFMGAHKGSKLWELCGGRTDRINGHVVFECFRAGDEAARLTVERFVEHLAAGVVSVINILEPELFCVGGGISNAWDCIEGPLIAAVEAEKLTRFSKDMPQTRITRAQLGNDAGIIGAAMLST